MNTKNALGNFEGEEGDAPVGEKTPPEIQRAPNASETHWAQASGNGLQRPVPRQFNEIDESASSQVAANPSMEAVGKQACQDVMTSVDTDRGPVLDAVYNGPVVEGHRASGKEKE